MHLTQMSTEATLEPNTLTIQWETKKRYLSDSRPTEMDTYNQDLKIFFREIRD